MNLIKAHKDFPVPRHRQLTALPRPWKNHVDDIHYRTFYKAEPYWPEGLPDHVRKYPESKIQVPRHSFGQWWWVDMKPAYKGNLGDKSRLELEKIVPRVGATVTLTRDGQERKFTIKKCMARSSYVVCLVLLV